MTHRNLLLFVFAMIACAGCSVKVADESISTTVPNFVTSTLPSTTIPQATSTSLPPTAIPTNAPIEGTTNTQVNVRAGASTLSASLGMVAAFAKVQVIGRDASGSWYQIIFAESESGSGWVRTEFVQVDDPGRILPVEVVAGSGSGVSGLVVEKINIRSGPGAEFESLGVLSPKDVVFITGKDPGGAWAQVEVAGVENLTGWVTVKYLQVESMDDVPVIGETANQTATPADAISTPIPQAVQDGDSIQTPLTTARFSPTDFRALQLNGDVSAPNGDLEDWVEFSTSGNGVVIQMFCTSDTLFVELWSDGKKMDGFLLECGETQSISVTPDGEYFLRIFESAGEQRHTDYNLHIEELHQ